MILQIQNLDVYYGRAHALQGVSLALDHGVLAVVGRNGMGKTTLCNAVTGLVRASGSVKLAGEEILGLAPNVINGKGVGYVPQGRRVWPSLSVDEHLRLARRRGPWTVERIYQTFPRLAERKGNGGAELSGGEQQMLAISRALLFNPKLLVMDEPTEGLAPIIVQQVVAMLKALASEGEISVLLIEQNLGVAIDVADTVDVMVNGRIARSMPTAELAADRELQQRLLGVKTDVDERPDPAVEEPPETSFQVLTVKRATDSVVAEPPRAAGRAHDPRVHAVGLHRPRPRGGGACSRRWRRLPEPRVVELPVAQTIGRAAYIAGTFDTKGRELFFLRSCLEKLGVRTVTVDLATSGKPSPAMVHPREVARHHPGGERAVFTGDRGSAVTEMAVAFEEFVARRRDIGGLISAGGSGGTALATRAMRRLPIGVPKVMVSTVASGDVRPYVGPSDICMMYSVTDVAGINRISEKVLANAAHALAGMLAFSRPLGAGRGAEQARPRPDDVRPHHAVRPGRVQAARDGVRLPRLPRHRHRRAEHGEARRLGPARRRARHHHHRGGRRDRGRRAHRPARRGWTSSRSAAIPYVGSCGALDMVNFWARPTVPGPIQGPDPARAQPERHVDAHHAG